MERLLAGAGGDVDLRSFLEERFLAPLSADPDRDLVATLAAYLDASCDISSTAAALGMDRQTIAGRIAAIEERIGRPANECLAELDLALRLRNLRS